MPQLVGDARGELFVRQRMHQAARDQQARAQDADERHQRIVGVDRECGNGRSGDRDRPGAAQPGARPAARAPPRRDPAHTAAADQHRGGNRTGGERQIESFRRLPRLVAPVRRQEYGADEERRGECGQDPQREPPRRRGGSPAAREPRRKPGAGEIDDEKPRHRQGGAVQDVVHE